MRSYTTPLLTSHGSVETITQAFGDSTATDTVFVGGSNAPGPSFPSSGSIDRAIAS